MESEEEEKKEEDGGVGLSRANIVAEGHGLTIMPGGRLAGTVDERDQKCSQCLRQTPESSQGMIKQSCCRLVALARE